jgi:hypothetical protein
MTTSGEDARLWKAAHDALKEYVGLLMAPMSARSALDAKFRAYREAHVAAVDSGGEAR